MREACADNDARVRMADVEPGRANMLERQRVIELKARKDVVLVNNKAFGKRRESSLF